MPEPLLIARRGDIQCLLPPALANRHGLVTGATGTGKTITLQALAEGFSRIGVPVFMADVKGDLTGISQAGVVGDKLRRVLDERGLALPQAWACPTTLWDVFGEQGHPVRATVCDLGPLLLARMLDLNETQTGVLNLVFKVADDHGLELLDLKDLRAMLQFVGENARRFTTGYGNVSAASVGAIQRALLQIEQQGGERFFGEPMLDVADLMQTTPVAGPGGEGRVTAGVVNILAAERLMRAPRLYATFLLWLLSELYETLPEVGDLDKPKLVFFFDEAHLLFDEAPKVLVERIELVVRLIRSKGVGVYFVTQNPLDIPDSVLAQLGHRVQHALRAFTPRDQKAVKAAATTMRANPRLDLQAAITELGVGEALVSLLDARGTPSITERVWVLPPGSRIGPVTLEERRALIEGSLVAGVYEQAQDRVSAFEKLADGAMDGVMEGVDGDAVGRSGGTSGGPRSGTLRSGAGGGSGGGLGGGEGGDVGPGGGQGGGLMGGLSSLIFGRSGPRGGRHEGLVEMAARSAVRTVGSAVGREIVRGVLGSLLGGGRRRR